MSKIEGVCGTLDGNCGVNLFYNFQFDTWSYLADDLKLGNTNLAVAGFIDTKECLAMYKKLAKKFNIAYQSTPRESAYSGKDYFFVVYDGKKPKPAKIKKTKPAVIHYNHFSFYPVEDGDEEN